MFSLCLLLSPYNLFRTAKRLTRTSRRLLLLFLVQKKELENVNTSQSNYSRRKSFHYILPVCLLYLSVCLPVYLSRSRSPLRQPLCIPDCPGTPYMDRVGLELT